MDFIGNIRSDQHERNKHWNTSTHPSTISLILPKYSKYIQLSRHTCMSKNVCIQIYIYIYIYIYILILFIINCTNTNKNYILTNFASTQYSTFCKFGLLYCSVLCSIRPFVNSVFCHFGLLSHSVLCSIRSFVIRSFVATP